MAIAAVGTREELALRYAAICTYLSLHTADPGTTGANEVSGGVPAYARKAITWNAGTVDGSIVSDPITFDVPAGTDITHVGMWDAVLAGNYRDSRAFTISFPSQGTVTLTVTYNQI